MMSAGLAHDATTSLKHNNRWAMANTLWDRLDYFLVGKISPRRISANQIYSVFFCQSDISK
jgi:hypothetical protein